MTKFTKTSLKKFIRENRENLLIKVKSKFDGMTDCVQSTGNYEFSPIQESDRKGQDAYTLGIHGLWLVGGSRDYFEVREENGYRIVEVYNCCGSTELAVKI